MPPLRKLENIEKGFSGRSFIGFHEKSDLKRSYLAGYDGLAPVGMDYYSKCFLELT